MQTLTQQTEQTAATAATAATGAKIKEVQSALTLENFRAWLQNHPETEVIGITGDCASCPIAAFLTEVAAASGVTVSYDLIANYDHSIIYFSDGSYGSDNSNKVPPVPRWVALFIHGVDVIKGKVTVANALYILEDIQLTLSH